MYNIEHLIGDPEDMGLCPLCDNVIMEWETIDIVCAYGVQSLAHDACIMEDMND